MAAIDVNSDPSIGASEDGSMHVFPGRLIKHESG